MIKLQHSFVTVARVQVMERTRTSCKFSPPPSSHASSENLHPLLQKLASPQRVPSAFSLDRPGPDAVDSRSSCLQDLLEWFAQRCCSFCSSTILTRQNSLLQCRHMVGRL
ncbi:hypothetical protein OIU77_013062 [Salix suchowensis]|uniref:Uncharacterized protein n=1 Tax=Salix suchowensis TaxID=1278906 RepID=A0ABQ8ZT92_9ROSI|nr:hypothetical protein OIU77_013062 [Salix suchowensis]